MRAQVTRDSEIYLIITGLDGQVPARRRYQTSIRVDPGRYTSGNDLASGERGSESRWGEANPPHTA